MEFLRKIMEMLDKPITYIVLVITTTIGISIDNGVMEKILLMFMGINILVFMDFILGFLNGIINPKRTVTSKKMGQTLTKLTSIYFVFISLSVLTIIIYGMDYPMWGGSFLFILFSVFILVVSRELLSLLETADDLGFPQAKKIKILIDDLPNLISKNKKGGDEK